MRVAITLKKNCDICRELAWKVLELGERELGLDMYIDVEAVDEIAWSKIYKPGSDKVNAVIVIGGDGTLFRFLHKLRECCDITLLTVKAGRRNFFMEVKPEELEQRLRDFAEGKYFIEEFPRLNVVIAERDVIAPPALNDVVIASWGPYRYKVIGLEVHIDEEKLYSVACDGVVIATPVGSTAYALSAGGPIVDHRLGCMVVVPIAPIQFNAKPVVISLDRKLRVGVIHGDAALVVDGQLVDRLKAGEHVEITGSKCSAKLVRFSRFSTYARLSP
ncbi:MAG: NAD(+)/NADH kinase [Ignisphaera sp.]|nr:NAD(+)/NADH kinase [Ignisphaera sp.]MCC6056702.1 NAD(+)/NADH kinase [Desulfurococcaceae archaeon]